MIQVWDNGSGTGYEAERMGGRVVYEGRISRMWWLTFLKGGGCTGLCVKGSVNNSQFSFCSSKKNPNNTIKKLAKDLTDCSKDIWVANKYMKKYSASLIIREMQIKTTMRYHFTPVRRAIMEKPKGNNCWWGCGETGTLAHCWWECKMVSPWRKMVWRSLKKLKIELPYDPAVPLLGIYPRKLKSDLEET